MKTNARLRSKRRDPIPVRFSDEEEQMLRSMKNKTGLAISNIIQRAVRFAVPKFQSGEVNPLSVPELATK